MKKKNVDMLSGSIIKGLLALAMPIMIMNVMQVIFNAIDLTALRYLTSDNYSVGAVGAGGSISVLCVNFLIGISTGANVVVAKLVGSKDKVVSVSVVDREPDEEVVEENIEQSSDIEINSTEE